MDNRIVTITPWIPKGYSGNKPYNPVSMMLIDDATLNQASSSGGWQIVDRPKQMAATQWNDTAPWQLSFKVYLNKSLTSNPTSYNPKAGQAFTQQDLSNSLNYISSQSSVEEDCAEIMSWVEVVPGTLLPPFLKIAGAPLPLQSGSTEAIQYWILYSATFNAAIRDPQLGFRVQQDIDLVFYQYVPPLNDPAFVPALGPAKIVNQAAQSSASSSSSKVQQSHRKNVDVGPADKTMTVFCQHYKVKPSQVTQTNGKQVPTADYPVLNKKFKKLQIP